MFKRILISWLIICTLGYGSAWAFDGHSDELASNHNDASDMGHMHGSDGDQPSCDHCCHASAHTVALWPTHFSAAFSGSTTGRTPYQRTLSSNNTTPPEHPPRS